MGKILIIKNADFSAVAVDKVDIVTKVQLNVLSSPTGGGTVTGSGGYAQGDVVTITATAAFGYRFVSWNDGNTEASRQITIGLVDKTYVANFAKSEYTYFIDYDAWYDEIVQYNAIQQSSLVGTTNTWGYLMNQNAKFNKSNGATLYLNAGTYNFTAYKINADGLTTLGTLSTTVSQNDTLIDFDFQETSFGGKEYLIIVEDSTKAWMLSHNVNNRPMSNTLWSNKTADTISINNITFSYKVYLNWNPYYKV